jgi:hypothetical protein
MKWVLYFVAVLFVLTGIVWILHGTNVLPGSFMSGQSQWAITGIVMTIVGIGLLVFAYNRQKGTPPRTG